MSLLSSWLTSPPPDAAVEISSEAISIATLASRGRDPVISAHAVEPLAPGAVVPSLAAANVVDRPAVAAALAAACGRIGARPRRVALVIPDAAARVSLVHFDHVPSRREDLEQLLQWQLRKSMPFAVEEALLTYSAGAGTGTGGDFVAAFARREVIREYEGICEEHGMHAGLVDLSTVAVLNLFLSADAGPAGDWLLVHMRPGYTSIALMRGRDLLFFRSRTEGEEEALADAVHQTTMYYQDRLAGQGFTRVFLGGAGRGPAAIEAARRSLEERLGIRVDGVDPTRIAAPADGVSTSPERAAALAPLVGMLLRSRREAVGV